MENSRILFVSHSAAVSGAEIVLIELAKSTPGASAFVFEGGPLQDKLTASGLAVHTSRWATGLGHIKRDGSPDEVLRRTAHAMKRAKDNYSADRVVIEIGRIIREVQTGYRA